MVVRRLLMVVLAVLVSVVVVSCGGGVPAPEPEVPVGDLVGLEVLPGDGVRFSRVGQRAELSVVGWTTEGEVLDAPAVSWSSSSTSVVVLRLFARGLVRLRRRLRWR